MTITVAIAPELQAELARQAAAQGRRLETYVAGLLEEAVHSSAAARAQRLEELENTLLGMAQFSSKIPALPDEAFTRESFYRDHDQCP